MILASFHISLFLLGLSGCILEMHLNSEPVAWSVTAGPGQNVLRCMLPPCENNVCRNGGTCEESSNAELGYVCACPPGFTGMPYHKRWEMFQCIIPGINKDVSLLSRFSSIYINAA